MNPGVRANFSSGSVNGSLWRGSSPLPILLLFAVIAALAITDRSFWIDECVTAEFGKQSTVVNCWRAMMGVSEVQQPLYMLYMWSCVHLVGSTELVLRAAGAPWFIIGATVFVRAFGRVIGSTLLPALLISSSAFVWYYLNEARVYIAELGLALALIGSAIDCLQCIDAPENSRASLRLFLLSLLLLCGTSVLAAAWGAFFLLGLLVCVPRSKWIAYLRLVPWSFAACGGGLVALAAYYGWTFTLHARATAVGTTTPQTMIFVFYELLGFVGLGPGRNELRASGASALLPYAGSILMFAVAVGGTFWNGTKELTARFGVKRVLLLTVIVGTPFVALCAIGIATRFRVLGRHVVPLLPLLWIVLAFGIVRLLQQPSRIGKIVAAAFFCLNFASSFSVRFAARHEKDDYRGAAAIARRAVASGETVWWNAERLGAAYYGLSASNAPGRTYVIILTNPTRDELRQFPAPSVVIASKPDTYDNGRAVIAYVNERQYRISARLPAFVVWTK